MFAVCIFLDSKASRLKSKSPQMSISTATVEEKTPNTPRMHVPVSPLLFVQLSHVQHVCSDAFDAG